MALWKALKGTRTALDTVEKHDGYVYFCTDDGSLHFDYTDSSGNLKRKQINAKEAEKLLGYDITTTISDSKTTIPTASAVFTALAGKANASHSHDDKYYTELEIDTKLSGKSDTGHKHAISDVTNLQTTLDGKASVSHGTHVTYSTTVPAMDGTASVGTATTVARSDHKHPTDTSRASQVDLDTLSEVVEGKADAEHDHAISDITGLQNALDGKAASSHGTHVSYSTTAPKMDGTAAVGTASTVSRGDHVHPTDTSRASQSDLTALTTVVNGKANASHGNHVPATETANNAKFLRNDNTWQTVTPTNIGAAPTTHSHSASDITSGTLAITRGGTGATTAADALKNLGIYIGPTEPTDTNIKIWINTAEEGTGVVPVLPRIATITLKASSWTGSAVPYKQTVTINTVTAATKIDLQPTATQLVALQNADISLMAENNNGTVTIYAFGGKPSSDMTMQVMLMEVAYV